MKTQLIQLLAALFLLSGVHAQDYIHLKDKSYIKCKVVEVGVDAVKYKNYPVKEDAAIISIEKYKILEIAMEDGTRISMDQSKDGGIHAEEFFYGQKTQAVKFDFFAPLNDNLILKYERVHRPGRSFEGWLGIPGVGFDLVSEDNPRPAGIFIGAGLKFISMPDYVFSNMRRSHILKGYYVRPSAVFTAHSFDQVNSIWDPNIGLTQVKERVRVVGFGLLIYGGRQWVFDDIFLIDFNIGIGYGLTSGDKISTYGFVKPTSSPLIVNSSLSIGLLFDSKKKN
ncbi:MAG: hypothetical protein ACK4KT_09240 [Thermaurantimonas sp.]